MTVARERAILEIGCGSAELGHLGTGSMGVAVDLDLPALLAAPIRSTGWRLACADARNLPFRGDCFDEVALRAVLHHLGQTDRAVRELARLLHPGGRLRVIDGVALEPAESAQLDQELRAAGLPPEPMYGFDLDRLEAAIARAGLEVASLQLSGTATLATPPFVSRTYTTDRFELVARRPGGS